MAIQSDGKIIVGGSSYNGSRDQFAVARYNADGNLDSSFNGTGKLIVNISSGSETISSVGVQADGKILLAGTARIGNTFDFALVRCNPDGTLDLGFNGTGKVITAIGSGDDHARTVLVQNDGRILVGGFASNAGNFDFALSRYNPDGILDTGFNGNGKIITSIGSGDEAAYGLALQADGKIVLAGDSFNGNDLDFALVRFLVSLPAVTSVAATGITTSGATLTGTINPNGAPTTGAFEYGLTTSYGNLVSTTPAPGSGGEPLSVSAAISGLQPNATYHYRLAATNGVGTTNGADQTFVTSANAPVVTTGSATNVSANGATLGGTVNPNGSTVTAAVVEFGLTSSYGMSVNVSPLPGSGTVAVGVSAAVSGLAADQTYHFRLSATNQAGGTSTGTDATFRTGAAAPAVTTGTAFPNVNGLGATLGGVVNPNGLATTAVFEFGLTESYGGIALAVPSPGSGISPINVSATINGLTPNRTYHYRLSGTSSGGSVAGEDAAFATPGGLPLVVTGSASDVTRASAALQGTVNPNGSSTMVRFFYGPAGTSLNTSTEFVAVGSGASDIPISATISGLLPFTDYEYRMEGEAENIGTRRGEVRAFKTLFTTLTALPDRAFATLGGPEFTIDVLANDAGDGLFIDRLIPSTPRGVAITSDHLALSFTPLPTNQFTDAAPETFGYGLRDVRNDPQNIAGADVTVFYFFGLRGTYFGNFPDGVGFRVLRLRLDLDFAGLATGRMEWDGEQYPFKVQFDRSGKARIAKARAGETVATLVADLQINAVNPAAITMSGTFRDTESGTGTINPVLQFLPADATTVPAKGIQIAFIDSGESGTGVSLTASGLAEDDEDDRPEGVGFSQVRITKKGRARFITKMPDFGAFSVGTLALDRSSAVDLPRYRLGAQIYKRGRTRLGVVAGDAFPGRSDIAGLDRISGALSWQRLLSRGGSENLIALMEGFRYRPGIDGVPIGFAPNKQPNATLRLSGGGLGDSIEFPISIKGKKAQVSDQDTSGMFRGLDMKLRFDLRSGVFSGSFLHPETQEKVRVIGGIAGEIGFGQALSLPEPRLRGSFHVKSTKRTGRIKIAPRQ